MCTYIYIYIIVIPAVVAPPTKAPHDATRRDRTGIGRETSSDAVHLAMPCNAAPQHACQLLLPPLLVALVYAVALACVTALALT